MKASKKAGPWLILDVPCVDRRFDIHDDSGRIMPWAVNREGT